MAGERLSPGPEEAEASRWREAAKMADKAAEIAARLELIRSMAGSEVGRLALLNAGVPEELIPKGETDLDASDEASEDLGRVAMIG